MHIKTWFAGIVFGAVIAAGIGIAYAAIPDSTGVVHACWQNVSGANKPVKLLNTSQKATCPRLDCRHLEPAWPARHTRSLGVHHGRERHNPHREPGSHRRRGRLPKRQGTARRGILTHERAALDHQDRLARLRPRRHQQGHRRRLVGPTRPRQRRGRVRDRLHSPRLRQLRNRHLTRVFHPKESAQTDRHVPAFALCTVGLGEGEGCRGWRGWRRPGRSMRLGRCSGWAGRPGRGCLDVYGQPDMRRVYTPG
jgi:hypothetical protein